MLLIALAGAVGTLARYGLTVWLGTALGTGFPFGTLTVNIAGSFMLGVVAEVLSGASIAGTDLRLVLGVGLMGGFTTYSSFNLETFRLLQHGELAKALGYIAATLFGCLAAGAAGVSIARFMVNARPP